MRAWVLATVLFVLSSPALAQVDVSVQEVLLRAKPAVALVVTEVAARVTLNCGSGEPIQVTPPPYREHGSGFLVTPSGLLITNAHVVSAAHQPPRWMRTHLAERAVRAACVPALLARRGLEPGQRPDVEDELARQVLVRVLPAARVALQPSISVILGNGARLPARVTRYSPPIAGEGMSGRDLALLAVEAADLPALALADSTRVKIGDRIHIIGFPGVVMSHELLNTAAKVDASVTNGAVSGLKQDRTNQPVMQIDASAEAGHSGGPVVNAAGEVVGVVTFATPSQADGESVQGFNFVIPSAAVSEFLHGAGARLDERSRFNAAWYAGLGQFFAGNYSSAARHLAEANRLLPELPDVRRVTTETVERAKTQPWLPWGRVGGALVGASVAGAVGLIAARLRRNRFRIAASDVARLLDSPKPPAILDVRDGATYARSPVRIPRSIHVTPEELEAGSRHLPIEPDRTVVAYCT